MAAMRNIMVTSNSCYHARSQRGARVCAVPTRDVAAQIRNLQNMKDKHAYQPAKKDATHNRRYV
jgi:hypothetical protein